jgi:hypothetical protein
MAGMYVTVDSPLTPTLPSRLQAGILARANAMLPCEGSGKYARAKHESELCTARTRSADLRGYL